MSNPRQRTIGHLQQLYTVVAGAALTVAITRLIDEKGVPPIRGDVLPYFFAYIFTLVPLSHGALRHLDITYFEDTAADPKRAALMADWWLLFFEGCLLLALAALLQQPELFSRGFCILLAFDCIWAFIAALAFAPTNPEYRVEWKWALINFVALLALLICLLYIMSLDNTRPVDFFWRVIVLLIATARTVWDYAWCWVPLLPFKMKQSNEGSPGRL
jgi:hypothetical protein